MSNQKKRQLSFITYEAYKKIKKDDPIKILFESINWSFISPLIKDTYPANRELVYDPIALFKSQLLIWLGEVESNRKLAKALRFNSRFCVLCGFDNFLKTPAHSTFSYFRKRIGKDAYFKILQRLIAQLAVIATIYKISISSNRLHIVVYSDDGKKSCNCSGSRCKYNKKQKHSKDEANVKLTTKNFVALGFKEKMVINASTQLPVEVILTPKE
ncbi:MAG: transposase [Candidatus Caldatribacteriota bacterium]|nr:transposase [Candidatus Caldatribacteriota bacterium]